MSYILFSHTSRYFGDRVTHGKDHISNLMKDREGSQKNKIKGERGLNRHFGES